MADEKAEPAVTGSLTEDSPETTRLLVGEGEVIVTVVCADGTYTAGTNDVSAMANAVLTPERIQLVNNGETVEVRVDVEDISDRIPQQDMETMEKGYEAYGKYLPELTWGAFMDISVYMKTGDSGWNAVAETKEPLEIVIGIPETLRGDGREYYVIRAHGDKYALLNDMDDAPDTITIISDMFSSYAIAYRQTGGVRNGTARCGLCHFCPTFLGICCFIWLAVIVMAFLLIWILMRRRKEEEAEKEQQEMKRDT